MHNSSLERSVPDPLQTNDSELFFGVIDVLNMQLTQLPCRISRDDLSAPQTYALPEQDIPPYVALSYVWGDT